MTAPNIVNVTNIYGKTALANVTTASSSLVQNPASSNLTYKINSIIISNIDGAVSADISVAMSRSGINYFIGKTITVPPDSSLVMLSKDSSIYLEEGDSITTIGSANNSLQIICGYETIGA